MNTKASPENSASSGLSLAHGVLLCLLTSIAAELLFEHFLEKVSMASACGRVSSVFIALYIIHRFALSSLRRYRPKLKDLVLLHLMLVGTLVIGALVRFLALALTAYMSSWKISKGLSPVSFHFVIPFATGAFVLQSVLGLHFGLVFTLSLTALVAAYSPGQMVFVPLVLVTNFVACLSLARLRSRSTYIRAGVYVGLAALPLALASCLTIGQYNMLDVILRLSGAFLSGILCCFIAAGVTPIVEYIGGYVTDIRLIEMATLDHPLLKELSVTAPGTWNHSMVIGMMVEAAADAIDANPVLARVGAYFHDLGKLKKPLYFVENQAGGENRHDKLSTSMSALIIRSHVKDGIELARKHRIPEVIVDMIPQHHGDSMIEYFYDKARKEAEEAGESVAIDKSLYAYPGPKPQSREAALLMLADGIEAASRTISEPTPDRIQGLVQKMINKVFASGELDECELTLKDLHSIAKCFTRVLTGIYHQRIAYAEPAEKVSEKAGLKTVNGSREASKEEPGGSENTEGGASKSKAVGEDKQKEAGAKGKENLKRLGL